MKVVIIAGGKGTRIQSVAAAIPKALMPVNGKPVAEYQIELAKRYGFTDILFLTGHLGEQVEEYFGDGQRWGVSIEYHQEEKPLGTAGSFAEVADKLGTDFWVFYGDTVMDFDMQRMLDFHKSRDSKATLFLHPNDHPDDSDLVDIDAASHITGFYPKPHDGAWRRNLVNAALYILSPETARYIPRGTKSDFGKDIFPAMLEKGIPLFGYVSAEYVKDMGTPDRYTSVCDDVRQGKAALCNRERQRPAFFFDRDGVINREVDLLSRHEQIELLPGAAEALRVIHDAGYLAVVVTNQPVIARGLCTLEELRRIHNKMETLLGEERAYLDAIYFCPHHPDKGYPEERAEYKIDCPCRKPKPGMLLQAARDFNIDLAASFMIGDSVRDREAGDAAGVKKSVVIERNKNNALLDAVKNLLQ